MQKERNPEERVDEEQKNRSRSSSRRSSITSRSGREKKKTSVLNSASSTPKKNVKEKAELMITGKQILKRYDRANSLPGASNRRSSIESLNRRKAESARCSNVTTSTLSPKTRETSLEDDMTLDLSQISDIDDQPPRQVSVKKFSPVKTSTPKIPLKFNKRSFSLTTNKVLENKMAAATDRSNLSFDSSKNSTTISSKDSFVSSSGGSNLRYGQSTELDYSSVSPEYSGASSSGSPRTSQLASDVAVVSPYSQRSQISGSSCLTPWQDTESDRTKVNGASKDYGEWSDFWANYNGAVTKLPMKNYYDQCPTPYRTENIDFADLEFPPQEARRMSPENMINVNNIIRNEGLHLTPRETQNIIKCAHILGNVLSKAIDRNCTQLEVREKELALKNEAIAKKDEIQAEILKKSLKLDLKEQNQPLPCIKNESVMTQTDISLPNTKSAPRIFEKILRQLSKSSLEDIGGKSKDLTNVDGEKNEGKEDKV